MRPGKLVPASATLLLATVGFASAADVTGGYIRGGGVGQVECPHFVAAMDRAKSSGIGTAGYVNEVYGYVMFLTGFQSAYNMQTAKTCDIFPRMSHDQTLAWVENYCRQNPLARFGSGVAELATAVHSKRLQSCQPNG